MKQYQYLGNIHCPDQLRELSMAQLEVLCAELRRELIDTVSHTGGHLASNLGTVELTVALHRELSLPQDTLLFDVGHQCYTHKLLTGRYPRFDTLRQQNGISGFPNPAESVYDPFIAGHSSTSVSVACGIAAAKRLRGENSYTVAVLGDGALTGGLAYEGLSNVREKERLMVVLNDNRMSISQNVGFAARHLTWLRSRSKYVRMKNRLAYIISRIPLVGSWLYRKLFRIKTGLKTVLYRGSSMFEDMGMYYFGPVDGHDIAALTRAIRIAKTLGRPALLHVVTQKGKGYDYAVQQPENYHGVSPFDTERGSQPSSDQTFSAVFGETLQQLAAQDERICAVTAAMSGGTGLDRFAAQYPNRFFDVGIAEGHAVTFASALASGGMIPVVALYSTFLQRAYDQLLNDTAIMHNHVVFAVDRAGLVPGDGETHQGLFDPAFLRSIPGICIDAPCNFAELRLMLRRAVLEQDGPAVVRYPRGGEEAAVAAYQPDGQPFTLLSNGGSVLLVTYGDCFAAVCTACEQLQRQGVRADILKLNRIWPLPPQSVQCAARYDQVFFFERSSAAGGIGEAFAAATRHPRCTLRAVTDWIACCTVAQAAHDVGLDADGICQTVLNQQKGESECVSP